MVHINRAVNKEFYVVITGENNEILSTTETMKTRRSCYKNIISQSMHFSQVSAAIRVQDNSGRVPVVINLWGNLSVTEAYNIVLSPVPDKKRAPYKGNKRQIK